MADEFKNKVEDLYKEHDFHTSEDWENLEDKCSECFSIMEDSRARPSRPSISDIHEYNEEVIRRGLDNYLDKQNDYRTNG